MIDISPIIYAVTFGFSLCAGLCAWVYFYLMED
jgi:hypothetical protein